MSRSRVRSVLLKCYCPSCGYFGRFIYKQIAIGIPLCGNRRCRDFAREMTIEWGDFQPPEGHFHLRAANERYPCS